MNDFLVTNGGPMIKLRLAIEMNHTIGNDELQSLAQDVLAIEKINTTINYIDGFKDYFMLSEREQYALVHNTYDYCFETFSKVLYEAGVRAGIEVLDTKVQSIIQPVYHHLITDYPFYATVIIGALFRLGYDNDDMIEFALHRIDQLHRISLTNEFDIYQKPEEAKHHPKWMIGNRILKEKYSPYHDELPLPLHYDIDMISRIPIKSITSQTEQKLKDIYQYIMNPKYQALGGDYGWLWDEKCKTYHANGCGVCIPFYNTNDLTEREAMHLLDDVVNLSYLDVFRTTKYYQRSLDYLEQYQTERGTYIFPESILPLHVKMNSRMWQTLIINKDVLAITKSNQRKALAIEIYSTYIMELLHDNRKKK